MHGPAAIDKGRPIDWGRTARDYASYRPGPPDSFYERLLPLGVGLPGQRMLDLGTGTGVLARRFARQGAQASGIDISPQQIAMAQALARSDGVAVDLRVAPAECTPFPDGAFDAVTANQCWLYFDTARTIPEMRRLLAPAGLLITSHFSWLPRLDPIARASEELILRFNPQWSSGDWAGIVPPCLPWAEPHMVVHAMFCYDEPIPFTQASWRGRMRACRGVGASLPAEEVRRFDAEHAALLERIAPERFTVLHRIDAHLLQFR